MSRSQSLVLLALVIQVLVVRETVPAPSAVELAEEKVSQLKTFGEEMQKSLNTEKDPCEGIFGYACSKRSEEPDIFPFDLKIEELVNSYIEGLEAPTDAELKLKRFVNACMNNNKEKNIAFFKGSHIFDFIEGFPATNPDWKADKIDLDAAIGEMEITFGPVVVDWSFNVKDSKRVAKVELEDFDFFEDTAKDTLAGKMTELEIPNPEEVINDGIQLEQEIMKIIKASGNEKDKNMETTFGNLKSLAPEIDWDKQVNIILKQSLPDDFDVVVEDIETIRKVYEAVSKMEPKVVVNYFFCQIVDYMPKLDDDRDPQCFSHANRMFSPILTQMFVNKYLPKEYPARLRTMFSTVANSIQKTFKNSGILPAKAAPELIERMVENIYLPQVDTDKFDNIYKNTEINDNCFLHNMVAMRRFERKVFARRYLSDEGLKHGIMKNLLPGSFSFVPYTIKNMPASVIYYTIIMDALSSPSDLTVAEIDENSPTALCLNDKLTSQKFKDVSIGRMMTAKALLDGYFEWADQYSNLVAAEDEVLKKYGLDNEKLLFVLMVRSRCTSKPEDMEKAEVFFSSINYYAEAFSCSEESRMNSKAKCEMA